VGWLGGCCGVVGLCGCVWVHRVEWNPLHFRPLAPLLQYLSNYATEDAPAGEIPGRTGKLQKEASAWQPLYVHHPTYPLPLPPQHNTTGWTLPAFPWFVSQTIAGAVATGSHGSSLGYGSLSSPQQLLGLELVLADGSVRRFNPTSHPFIFKALRVSVGRLGVITRVKLRIVREAPVRRSLVCLSPPAFLIQMRTLQQAALAAGLDAGAANRSASTDYLSRLPAWANETQWFWVPQKHEFLMVNFHRADDAAAAASLTEFRPDATTVFESKGALLALGELHLPADAVFNFTQQQLAGNQPLVPAADSRRSAAGGRLYQRAAEVLDHLNGTEISAPLLQTNDSSPAAAAAADPALGETWLVPTPPRPSGRWVWRCWVWRVDDEHQSAHVPLACAWPCPIKLHSARTAPATNPICTVFYAAANMADGTNEVSRIGIFNVAGNKTVESTVCGWARWGRVDGWARWGRVDG